MGMQEHAIDPGDRLERHARGSGSSVVRGIPADVCFLSQTAAALQEGKIHQYRPVRARVSRRHGGVPELIPGVLKELRALLTNSGISDVLQIIGLRFFE